MDVLAGRSGPSHVSHDKQIPVKVSVYSVLYCGAWHQWNWLGFWRRDCRDGDFPVPPAREKELFERRRVRDNRRTFVNCKLRYRVPYMFPTSRAYRVLGESHFHMEAKPRSHNERVHTPCCILLGELH